MRSLTPLFDLLYGPNMEEMPNPTHQTHTMNKPNTQVASCETTHTPTPWEIDSYVDDEGRETLAITSDNRPGYIVGVQCAEGVTIDDTDKANAAFILKAVNCHDDLLSACKVALQQFNDSMFIWGKDDDKSVCHMTKALANAITKAEGKPL